MWPSSVPLGGAPVPPLTTPGLTFPMDKDQSGAVAAVLALPIDRPSLPLLLHGAAGTGKTQTLVECVVQILRLHGTNARYASQDQK